jgi:hypothetical protein
MMVCMSTGDVGGHEGVRKMFGRVLSIRWMDDLIHRDLNGTPQQILPLHSITTLFVNFNEKYMSEMQTWQPAQDHRT